VSEPDLPANEPTLPDKIVAIDERLREARIPHAFGGALALAYYAEPRATDDIDVNVFVAPARFARVRDALAPLGVSGEVAPDAVEDEGQCRLWWGRSPVDLFFAYDDLHVAMRKDARTVPFGDSELPILAPEHLVVCKAVFDRAKDWLDIEQMLVCVDHLDVEEIRAWLDRNVGRDDARAQRFDAMARELLEGK
jgi:hypothetical protein